MDDEVPEVEKDKESEMENNNDDDDSSYYDSRENEDIRIDAPESNDGEEDLESE